MKLAVLRETAKGETRVALTPDACAKLTTATHTITVETDAGALAGFADERYAEIEGVTIAERKDILGDADLILCVQRPAAGELPQGASVLGLIDPFTIETEALNQRSITALAMEFTPRISRAQSMDALSSQSNLAGYRAVIEAASLYGRALPLMMTAAGTVAPAKVFVMGAGVAGLQAIATARRLGAIVTATDVRAAAKEQVASLGAKFVAVEDDEFKAAETAGGYAKQMSEAYQAKQAALIAEHIAKQDIVITTALIPGRPAPILVSEDMVAAMSAGSVIIDMAVAQGGNCPLSKPDEVVDVQGVKIAGFTNLPARLPGDASALYARNISAFLPLITAEDGTLHFESDDEIVKAMVITRGGETVSERLIT
ncbi:MAG: Re/Si-specific NAD(P)(+) transhydrogenase subunit alpha [Pseudomonadota bacterium]